MRGILQIPAPELGAITTLCTTQQIPTVHPSMMRKAVKTLQRLDGVRRTALGSDPATGSSMSIPSPAVKHSQRITKEGSDADGRILAVCPEFICIAKPDGSRVVESTAEIDRALAIALFGISDAGNSDVRLALARALLGLRRTCRRAADRSQ